MLKRVILISSGYENTAEFIDRISLLAFQIMFRNIRNRVAAEFARKCLYGIKGYLLYDTANFLNEFIRAGMQKHTGQHRLRI